MTACVTRSDFDVSIVIPTRDRWPLVETALRSALAQHDARVRAIVVNDGSTDETRDGLERVDDDRIVVVHHDVCRGVSASRNSGLAEVDTEWVAFLDDDDVLGPHHVAGMLRAADNRRGDVGQVGLVYSGYVSTDRERRPLSVRIAAPEDEVADDLLSRNAIGPPAAVLLRTEAVRRAGGFDEQLSLVEDWDMWIRISQRYILARSPELQVGYMLHPSNGHLAVDRFLRDLSLLEAKHGAAAAARGRRLFGGELALYLAWAHRSAGRRIRASAWYLRGFLDSRSPRHLALAGAVLLGEGAIERARIGRRRTPPQVAEWLDAIGQPPHLVLSGKIPSHLLSEIK